MNLRHYCRTESLRALLFAASGASACFLSLALAGQFGFGLHPCELCLAQRVPYAAVAMLGLLAGLYVRGEKNLYRVAVLCGLLFIADGGIAAYHSGVESGLFKGPSACTNNDKPGQTLEEMRAAILHAQLVPCDQPMVYVFGLSMASWNVVAATAASIATFAALVRIRRRRDG